MNNGKIKNLISGSILTAVAVLTLGLSASAQSFTSTAELKLACETSLNNIVQINVPIQISSGPQAPATETVNTRCTIRLGQFASFEASQVSMTFGGPLRFEAANEAHIRFIESEFTAPSMSYIQTSKAFFNVERSLLRATVGGITVNSGVEGSVAINGPLVGGNLVAAGAVNLTGGSKYQCSLTDAIISAGTGFNINMTGSESNFVSTSSNIAAANGAINVTGSGDKSFAEFKFNSVTASPRGVNVRLNGNESEIVANQFTIDGGTGVILRTGGNKGKVTMDDGTVISNGAAQVQASATGLEGVAIVTRANFNAAGSIRVETGSIGSTEVLDSNLTSNTLIRFATGAGGSCKSQNNILSAPTLQVCQ